MSMFCRLLEEWRVMREMDMQWLQEAADAKGTCEKCGKCPKAEREKMLHTPFQQELIKHGMCMELTDRSKELFLRHTNELAVLNQRLLDLTAVLSKSRAHDKSRVYGRLLMWVVRNLMLQ